MLKVKLFFVSATKEQLKEVIRYSTSHDISGSLSTTCCDTISTAVAR